MVQPGIDPDIQKAQTLMRGFGFHSRVRGENGQPQRVPLEVTGINDSLTQRSLQKFRIDNGLPPNADMAATIARMEQADVATKYRESLQRQGFQYPYTGQTIAPAAATAPATGTAAPAQAPAATTPPPAATAAQKTEAASYLMMMGYDVTEDETRTAINDVKLMQAIDSFRQANQIPATATPEEMLPRLRAGLAADPMSVEIMMGVSNSATPTALEAGALQYGLQAQGFNVPITGQKDDATRAAMTQLVDRHQAQLDSGAIVQTPNGYARPGQPQAAAPEATVEQAQAYLKILGYNNVGLVDNIRGPMTNAALTQFARDNQLAEDASLNDLTAALKAKVISDPNVLTRAETIINAANPSRSEGLAAQYAVNAIYSTIPNGAQIETDGIVGPRTESAFNHIKANPTVFNRDQAAPTAAATTSPPAQPSNAAPENVAPATTTAPATSAPVAAPVAAAPVGAYAGAPAVTGNASYDSAREARAAQRRETQPPVESPGGHQIGHGGKLAPYYTDVASMRGGADYNYERPPSPQELNRERRESQQNGRLMGQVVENLLDNNDRNNGRAFNQIVQLGLRL
ncbi:MAG: peptidoglycan-binding domain-containing protein [Micavibrio sp.]